MSNHPITQIEYDQLAEIEKAFEHLASLVEERLNQLQAAYSDLKDDGWMGESADAFFKEMEESLLPANKRLVEALYEGGHLASKIIETMQIAEEEAAAQISFEVDSTGGQTIGTASSRTETGEKKGWAQDLLTQIGLDIEAHSAEGQHTIQLDNDTELPVNVRSESASTIDDW
ncbi:MAG: WXG100 family type VII secretion target [Chloroflexota bacterium]